MTEILDSYLGVLQQLIMWENPVITGATFLTLNLMFWLMVRLEWRFYGILFSACLLAFICDAGLQFCGFHSNDNQSNNWSQQIVALVAGIVEYLRVFRDKHPNTFRAYMVGTFLTLNVLSRAVSGIVLTQFGLLFVFAAPLIVTYLPEETRNMLCNFCFVLQQENEVAEEDLEPKEVADDIESESIAESCTGSFVSGLNAMPSYHEVEGSLDGLDDEDLNIPAVRASSLTPCDSSDSEVEIRPEINFESLHFRDNDSSDEEKDFVEGVKFHDATNREINDSYSPGILQNIGSSLLTNLGTVGSNLVSAVLKQTTLSSTPVPSVQRQNSDSDSDFEIVDSDDVRDKS